MRHERDLHCIGALELQISGERHAEVEASEEECDLHNSLQGSRPVLLEHDVHDLLILCISLRAHEVGQVTKDDEFDDEGYEYPEWAVELRIITFVMVNLQ